MCCTASCRVLGRGPGMVLEEPRQAGCLAGESRPLQCVYVQGLGVGRRDVRRGGGLRAQARDDRTATLTRQQTAGGRPLPAVPTPARTRRPAQSPALRCNRSAPPASWARRARRLQSEGRWEAGGQRGGQLDMRNSRVRAKGLAAAGAVHQPTLATCRPQTLCLPQPRVPASAHFTRACDGTPNPA